MLNHWYLDSAGRGTDSSVALCEMGGAVLAPGMPKAVEKGCTRSSLFERPRDLMVEWAPCLNLAVGSEGSQGCCHG